MYQICLLRQEFHIKLKVAKFRTEDMIWNQSLELKLWGSIFKFWKFHQFRNGILCQMNQTTGLVIPYGKHGPPAAVKGQWFEILSTNMCVDEIRNLSMLYVYILRSYLSPAAIPTFLFCGLVWFPWWEEVTTLICTFWEIHYEWHLFNFTFKRAHNEKNNLMPWQYCWKAYVFWLHCPLIRLWYMRNWQQSTMLVANLPKQWTWGNWLSSPPFMEISKYLKLIYR